MIQHIIKKDTERMAQNIGRVLNNLAELNRIPWPYLGLIFSLPHETQLNWLFAAITGNYLFCLIDSNYVPLQQRYCVVH